MKVLPAIIIFFLMLRVYTTAAVSDTTGTVTTVIEEPSEKISKPRRDISPELSAGGLQEPALPGAADSAADSSRPHFSPGSVLTDTTKKTVISGRTSLTSVRRLSNPGDTFHADTSKIRNGFYFSGGLGWSLGGFTLLDLWENSLPDSLGSLGLFDTSFRILPDTSTVSQKQTADTIPISFSVKENPAQYTMFFPLFVSFVRIGENDRLSFTLYGAWLRKVFSASITAKADSPERKVDYREQMNILSAFFSLSYGRLIPREYFSIEGVERSYLSAAFEIAPFIACNILRKAIAPSTDVRFGLIRDKIVSPESRFLHGSAAALRLGINTLKQINATGATDFAIAYCLQGYGFFFEKGDRVAFNTIDPSNIRKTHPLYWLSNRFEMSIAIMRKQRK